MKIQRRDHGVWYDSETIGISNFQTNVTKTFEPGRSTIVIFYYNKNTNQMINEKTN